MSVPSAVYVIWWVMLIVTVVVVVPIVVTLLHRTFRAARQIERYAAKSLEGGIGIAGNTANIQALEATIATAGSILGVSKAIEEHTGTIEQVLGARAGSMGR